MAQLYTDYFLTVVSYQIRSKNSETFLIKRSNCIIQKYYRSAEWTSVLRIENNVKESSLDYY